MKVKVTHKDVDKGYKRIMREMEKSKDAYALIGVHEGAGKYPDEDLYIGTVAFWNEFGTKNVPERPFIRFTMTEKEGFFRRESKKFYHDVLAGLYDTRKALDKIGFRIASEIQNKIRHAKDWATPLAESTIQRKMRKSERRHTKEGTFVAVKTLIDSGLMLRSIAWQSVIKNSKSELHYSDKEAT